MRLVPVLDIRQGVAVHARGGEREGYRPVRSCVAPSADPVTLLGGLTAVLGCREVYVADLDALEQTGNNLSLIGDLGRHHSGAALLVDAGVRSPADARRVLDIGATRVVLASETSAGPHQVAAIGRAVGFEHVVCSLDMRRRSVVWGAAAHAVRRPADALASLCDSGIRSVLILEMDRVGMETGIDVAFLAPLIRRHAGVEILVGGGVRDLRDLIALRDIGAAGALVATAVHRGTLSGADVALLSGEIPHGRTQAGS